MARLSPRRLGAAWLLAAACALVCGASPAAAAPAGDGFALHVTVRAAGDGTVVSGARVTVAGSAAAADTGHDGRVTLTLLDQGYVTVRVTAPGFRPIEATLQVSEPVSALEIALSPAVIRIDEAVFVAADRLERVSVSLPRSTTIVGRAVLDERSARTAPEVLQDQSGGWVQKTNHGGGSPFVRGLVGNHVLVVIDGVRLNNATFRLGPNQYMNTVDAYALDRIEVLKGSGSVAYGSDALGGVINLVTSKPALSPAGVTAGGAAATRFAGRGMEASARLEGFVSGRQVAARGGVTYRAFGDLAAGGNLGVLAPSAYREADVDGSLLWAPAARTRVSAVFQHVHLFDVPRYDQVALRGYEVYSFDPQIRRLGYVTVDQRVGARWLDAVRLTASWHRSEEGRVRRRRLSTSETREADVVSTGGVSLDLQGRPAAWLTWSGGAEGYHDAVRSWGRDTDLAAGTSVPRRGLYPDGAARLSLSAFVLATARAGRATVDLGSRYTRDRVRADDPGFGATRISPDAVVNSAAAGYAVAPWMSLFGSVSQAFRAPNIDDLSTLGPFDFGIEVPPGTLKPERSLAVEGGLRISAGRLAASASVYRLGLRDLIDRQRAVFNGTATLEGQDIYRRANIGEAWVRGAEADFEWCATAELSVSGFVATTDGRQTAADIPLRRIPPANGSLTARYRWRPGLWAEANIRAARTQDRLAPGDVSDHRIPPGGTPGWTVANLAAGVPIGNRITVTGGLANVFDEAYRVHGSGVDGPGRHLWVSARAVF